MGGEAGSTVKRGVGGWRSSLNTSERIVCSYEAVVRTQMKARYVFMWVCMKSPSICVPKLRASTS